SYFVRPIDRSFVSRLKSSAMICLMWAPWEFRDADIDRSACEQAGVPIVGTNEEHPNIRTFDYVGILAARLLLERHIEILGARISVIGSDPFGASIGKILRALGADVRSVDPTGCGSGLSKALDESFRGADAVVLAEHRDPRVLIGAETPGLQTLRSQG